MKNVLKAKLMVLVLVLGSIEFVYSRCCQSCKGNKGKNSQSKSNGNPGCPGNPGDSGGSGNPVGSNGTKSKLEVTGDVKEVKKKS